MKLERFRRNRRILCKREATLVYLVLCWSVNLHRLDDDVCMRDFGFHQRWTEWRVGVLEDNSDDVIAQMAFFIDLIK